MIYNCGIYKLTSPSGKCYIGQSLNLKERLRKYSSYVCKRQLHLHNALQKYRWENFKVEILLYASDKYNLDAAEKYYIKKFDTINSGYNLTEGGNGCRHTQETKDKISKANKGRKRPWTQEWKDKIKAATWASSSWTNRKPCSDATKHKIRLANLGKKASEAKLEKMRAHRPSEETRQKMSIAQILRNQKLSEQKGSLYGN